MGLIAVIVWYGKFSIARSASVSVPTEVVTTPAVVRLTQDYFRWYENIDALTPSSTLAAENTSTSVPDSGTVLRLRMNIIDGNVDLPTGTEFKLQYANSTSGPWTDLSTSTSWIFFNNPSVADGQIILTTVLSNSNTGESYNESNPSASTPNTVVQGQRGEWDWVIENNSADTASNWFFRMIYSSSTVLDSYNRYPKLTAVPVVTPPPSSGGGGGSTGVGGGQTTPPPPYVPPGNQTTTPPLPIPPPLLPPPIQAVDFNGDNRVNIIDLSILLYYYNKTGPQITRYDLNRDLAVDFPDVSIMMFYWTS